MGRHPCAEQTDGYMLPAVIRKSIIDRIEDGTNWTSIRVLCDLYQLPSMTQKKMVRRRGVATGMSQVNPVSTLKDQSQARQKIHDILAGKALHLPTDSRHVCAGHLATVEIRSPTVPSPTTSVLLPTLSRNGPCRYLMIAKCSSFRSNLLVLFGAYSSVRPRSRCGGISGRGGVLALARCVQISHWHAPEPEPIFEKGTLSTPLGLHGADYCRS